VSDLRVAAAEAAALVAEANVAAATALAAAFEAVAAGLQDLAALGVAAGAGDAATLFGVLALALAAAQIANADLLPVALAAAKAVAFANRLAQAVQFGAFAQVVAAAMNAEAAFAFLKRNLARHGVLHVELWRGARNLVGSSLGFGNHITGH
jgi:hypothetical protein